VQMALSSSVAFLVEVRDSSRNYPGKIGSKKMSVDQRTSLTALAACSGQRASS
jgi:hypothetical protein